LLAEKNYVVPAWCQEQTFGGSKRFHSAADITTTKQSGLLTAQEPNNYDVIQREN